MENLRIPRKALVEKLQRLEDLLQENWKTVENIRKQLERGDLSKASELKMNEWLKQALLHLGTTEEELEAIADFLGE